MPGASLFVLKIIMTEFARLFLASALFSFSITAMGRAGEHQRAYGANTYIGKIIDVHSHPRSSNRATLAVSSQDVVHSIQF